MTREEAANILDPEIDIQYLFDFIREHYGKRGVDSSLLCERVDAEACRMGAAALRALDAQENPEPLTLEELRQMNGEPVWIVEHPDWGHWELAEDAEDYLMDRDEDFYGMKHNDPLGRFGLHVLGWLAYRHKPKEETK